MEIFLGLVIVIILIIWLVTRQKLKNEINRLIKHISELVNKVNDLENINNKLKKYEGLLDIEKQASEILNIAKTELENAKSNAIQIINNSKIEAQENFANSQKELGNAKIEAETIKSQIREEQKIVKQKNEAALNNATIEAGKIIETANKRAEEIAGEAHEAMKNVSNLEKTAQAMKNVINGYGDLYLIPTYTLLDELADAFGFTEAGEELKKARERTKLMVRNGLAAKCDYVENNRKETAINFVTDAFNGKVDTILSNLKQDNHGTLSQKVKDAFYLVNNLGKAFRNAVITEEYLKSRLEELRWGAIVFELKNKEKEEQRIIKERIREEERAKKEFERALKEAEKEEEMLRKAMEKVQKELGQASEQQKAKYEAQLLELADKLKIAEEKGQRALSMAQQTKTGHVYIISNIGSFGENVYKIGMTRRLEPLDRVKELGDASVPFEFDVHAMIMSDNAPNFENELHKKFLRTQVNKINPRKEFFKLSLKELREEVERLGINAKWTMTAEAREYKESLAIEKQLENNSAKQAEWIKQQMEFESKIDETENE